MPIYQYLCPTCNHKFELKRSFHDDCEVSCPKCNNGAKKLFIPVPIIFKGSGFYVTDSSKKSDVQDSPKETKAEKKDDSKVTKSEESAPATAS